MSVVADPAPNGHQDLRRYFNTPESDFRFSAGAFLANSAWVREGFKRIPADSFLYTLTQDNALQSLMLKLKDMPSFTDWSVSAHAWDKGLHSVGFSHFSQVEGNPYLEWSVAGPAGPPGSPERPARIRPVP